MRTRGGKARPPAGRHVAFAGAEYIEFDTERAAVVRLCGVAPPVSSGGQQQQQQQGDEQVGSAELECLARGLDAQAVAALEAQYADEIRQALALRGFSPLGDGLDALRTQLRAADLLLTWAAIAAASAGTRNVEDGAVAALKRALPDDWKTRDVADPGLLRRAQLAKKELEGRVDEGYAFGRRFISAEAFVDALERAEMLEMASERGLEPPQVSEEEKAGIKIPDRDLVALRGPGAGKTLKQLTLRELVAEAQAHGVDVEHERDGGAHKSKRAWIDVLRPLTHDDMVKIRVLMREEVLLRELLTNVVEREAAEDQQRRIAALVQRLAEQFKAPQPDAEPASESPTSASDGVEKVVKSIQSHGRIDQYLMRLAGTMLPLSE